MEKYFSVKAKFETLTLKGKVKKTTEQYLVQAEDVRDAEKKAMISLSGSMRDFEISAISETKIIEVFSAKQTVVQVTDISNAEPRQKQPEII